MFLLDYFPRRLEKTVKPSYFTHSLAKSGVTTELTTKAVLIMSLQSFKKMKKKGQKEKAFPSVVVFF